MKTRRNHALVLTLSLAILASGCGGGGGGSSSDDDPTTTATPEATTTTAARVVTTAPPDAATTTSGDDGTTTTEPVTATEGDGVLLDLTAVDLLYSTDELQTQAGVETTVYFHHNDYEPHNFHLVLSEDGSADIVSVILGAPAEDRITFTIEEPGEYRYFCDTHPLDMHGTLVVSP